MAYFRKHYVGLVQSINVTVDSGQGAMHGRTGVAPYSPIFFSHLLHHSLHATRANTPRPGFLVSRGCSEPPSTMAHPP